MKKKNLEKLVQHIKETINLLLETTSYKGDELEYAKALKDGQKIVLLNLLKYIDDDEKELIWREKIGLDEIF